MHIQNQLGFTLTMHIDKYVMLLLITAIILVLCGETRQSCQHTSANKPTPAHLSAESFMTPPLVSVWNRVTKDSPQALICCLVNKCNFETEDKTDCVLRQLHKQVLIADLLSDVYFFISVYLERTKNDRLNLSQETLLCEIGDVSH